MSVTAEPRSLPDSAYRVASHLRTWVVSQSTTLWILGSTIILIVAGLLMVLSTSSIEALAEAKRSSGAAHARPFAAFYKQAASAVVGLIGFGLASRVPVRVWSKLWLPAWIGSTLLLLLVFTPLGVEQGGNRAWLDLGMSVQPGEAAKLGLILAGAYVLANKAKRLHQWVHVLVPVVMLGTTSILLVVLSRDLGTAMVLMAILGGMLFAAGVPMRMMGAVAGGVGAIVATAVLTSQNRRDRILAWRGQDSSVDTWQSDHSMFALATGGVFGQGLGASREKWSYIPEAHNDFIFAVLGEELGLVGCLLVLTCIGVLGYSCYRIIKRHDNMFVRIAAAGIFTWIVGQSVINVSVVVGLLPVLGVPLPLVSSGGSSLVTTMCAIGVLYSFARDLEKPAKEVPSVKQPRIPFRRRVATNTVGRRR